MLDAVETGAAAEWRRYFMLPLAAALGYATSVFYTYGTGPYIVPVSQAFGWSRLQTTSGMTIATLVQAALAIPVGILVDRYGPRWFGLIGVLIVTGAFALLATASGDHANWLVLWTILGIVSPLSQATVWTSAVTTRFDRSRGLALAVTMCGASLAAGLFPLLATWLIQTQGWRSAFAWQGGIWAVFAFPFIFFFFRGERDSPGYAVIRRLQAASADMTLAAGFRSSIYLRMIIATFFIGTAMMALIVHFVPILREHGAEPYQAAGIASLVGLAAIAGRLGTGVLLDRFRATMVGALAFLLPLISSALLLAGGDRPPLQSIAAILIGLALGAEVDVLAYVTTRYFGLNNFGALFGGQVMAVSLGAAVGPLAAAAAFDSYGSYAYFLWFTMVCMLTSSVLLASLPRLTART